VGSLGILYYKITKNNILGRARVKKIFSNCRICAHTRPVRSVGGPGLSRAENAQVQRRKGSGVPDWWRRTGTVAARRDDAMRDREMPSNTEGKGSELREGCA
jgi:hypothetical protein